MERVEIGISDLCAMNARFKQEWEGSMSRSIRSRLLGITFILACSIACFGVFATQAFADSASEPTAPQASIAPAGDETGLSACGTASDDGVLVAAEGDADASDQSIKAQANDQQGGDDDEATKADTGETTEPSDKTSLPANKPTKAGWLKDTDGTWYYFTSVNSTPKTGWIKSGGKWYWLAPDQNGAMATSAWVADQGKRYYVDGKGVMKTGWIKTDEGWYYANKSGAQQKGWVKSGSKWYWLQGDEQGLMAASKWITDKNKRYYLTGSGAMATKWIQIDQDWYYANNSGAQQMSGWVKSGSKWYWLDAAQDGKMATSAWITDKGKRYYLDGNGAMATKWIHTGDDWYYANKSGAQQNGWVKSGGKWYWLQTDKQGLMAANESLTISGALYSFTDSGAMRTNTTVDLEDNKVGYATSSGAIVPVGAKENGKLVLRSAQGAPLTGWQKFGGAWFYGDEGGVAHTGWLTLKGKKYWLDDNGVMATGLRTIDGKRYVFSPSGAYVPVSAAHAAVFERAVKELERCTNASMTKEQKLRAAFNHIRDDFREYNPRIPHMKRVGWETIYADDVFIGRGGNCLSYAAAFAFMAKAIGYENVYACNRGHAWVEIDGRVYDPEWEKNHRSENYFNRAINASGGPGYTNKQGEPWMRVAI